jgi:phenylalanyl-tRNA synthetase alpha chain
MHSLPPHQHALLTALHLSNGENSLDEVARTALLDQSLASAAAVELEQLGYLAIAEEPYLELKLGEHGVALTKGEAEFPERLVARILRRLGGTASLKQLADPQTPGVIELEAAGAQAGKFARNLTELGWASFEKGTLALVGDAAEEEPSSSDPEHALTAVYVAGGTLHATPATDPRVLHGAAFLKQRKELLVQKERTRRRLVLTPAGRELARLALTGKVAVLREANELTPELLKDGAWRDVQFRAYDVTLAAETLRPGKSHPLVRVIERVRQAFLELGFSEAGCPLAESAFWDFDALFQPQDHPAREMQDTMYLKHPGAYPLPGEPGYHGPGNAATVAAVRATHIDGGATGSKGWRYAWSLERARQVVLRTHMTASSIRAVARNPLAPQKVFSIGRVFRRETVDATHLPEFHQVDGIIIDEQASLASLMGTLRKFYERLGIHDVKLKPAFFPYTEPSVEVHIQWAGRWMEMGGAGIFRPEVTQPFGCTAPVLAWGLGLERLAMAVYGITSIKDLYQSDLDWLKAVPLTAGV